MILNLTDWPEGQPLEADVCVVGAGPVGIVLALDLAAAGRRVLLLEAGGRDYSDDVQAHYRGEVADSALHPPLDEYRRRQLGGSSTIWGGRCVPFDPIDFRPRDWVAGSGWPFGREELAPYYPAANRWCEAGAFAYTVDSAFDRPVKPMIAGFAGSHYSTDTLERFSAPTDFGRRYLRRMEQSPRLTVVLEAAVLSVDLHGDGGLVKGLTVAAPDGTRHSVRAGAFVLAAGGLETVRLMLASRSVQPNGVGNQNDVVGRYYQAHLAGTIGGVALKTAWHGYDVADDGTYCRRRLALTEETQRAERIGNFVARLHHPRISDARHGSGVLSALYLGRAAIPAQFRKRLEDADPEGFRGTLRHATNLLRDAPRVAKFMGHMLFQRKLAERKFPSIIVEPRGHRYSLDFHAEQEPNPDSRVTLSTATDALGMPQLRADWRYSAGDVATVTRALALLKADIEGSQVGTFDYAEADIVTEMTRYGAYPGHHIGTARMGDDPRTSVVDAHAKVHGIANLHLAGASIFPTSGQANPTLTAVALALRLSNRLKEQAA